MLNVEARRGRTIFFGDLLYLDLTGAFGYAIQ